MFLYAFEESVDCHLLSSFCDDSNLHISLFKYVLSTMGVSKESISKFLIGNRFHVKLRILSPYSNLKGLRMRNFMWNRFPIKNLLIDFLLTPIVESTYLKIHFSFTLKTFVCVVTVSKWSLLYTLLEFLVLMLLVTQQLNLRSCYPLPTVEVSSVSTTSMGM